MVAVHKPTSRPSSSSMANLMLCIAIGVMFLLLIKLFDDDEGVSTLPEEHLSFAQSVYHAPQCLASLSDLQPSERFPKAGERYIVDPPPDTKLTLVCCQTTKGPWSILVRHAWAPLGAQRFLDMVTSGYFNKAGVPLMRCVANFLCQFGLAGEASRDFALSIQDDPQWLPAGKDWRIQHGVKRFAKGYLSYAGGGPHTRDNQLFVALGDNGPLGGGSPWEVPWGELVGEASYATLNQIYTDYGEKGPTQASLWKDDGLEKARQEFPLMDWVTSCHVVEEQTVQRER